MAIKAYSAGITDNGSVPVIDTDSKINHGDMLYFDSSKNLFVPGLGIVVPTKLSEFENDKNYTTQADLAAALAEGLDGGTVDLTGYSTKDYVDNLFSSVPRFSGDYYDLANKPDIPTDTNDLTNGAGFVTDENLETRLDLLPIFSGNYNDLINKPNVFNGDYNNLSNRPLLTDYATKSELAEAIAGIDTSEIDLTPYITSADAQALVDSSVTNINVFSGDYNDLINKPTPFSGLWDDIVNRPTIFSGDYNDLTNKPSIPNLDGYASIALVQDLINGIPTTDLTGYATENWVTTQLNNYQPTVDLTNYVTETELATELANYQPTVDLTGYASVNYVADQLSQIKSDTASNWLETDPSSTEFIQNKPDLSVYATEAYVAQEIANVNTGGGVDLAGYVTETELSTAIASIDIPQAFSGDYADLVNTPAIPDINGLASETWVTSQLAGYQPTVDLSAYYTSAQVDAALAQIDTGTGNGNVDLTGYATETYVNQQLSAASLDSIAYLDDLTNVAIGSLPQTVREDEFYLLEYNPVNQLWESRDFGSVFATQSYVSSTIATALTNGEVNLDGYATEQYVEQKLVERGHHFSGDYNDLVNTPILFSGNYADLTNKPALKEYTITSQGTILNLVETAAEPDNIVATVDLSDLGVGFSGNYTDLANRPNLFSGNYNDLANKPYIPSIAGLSTEEYVDNRWAEPEITGDRFFTDNVTHEQTVTQKTSIVSHTAQETSYAFAIQTTDAVETQVLLPDSTNVNIEVGTTAMFKATVVAVSDSVASSFIVRGVINNSDAGISIIGNNTVETLSDSDLNWQTNITAGTANNIEISVTGSETTVDWTIFLTLTAVKR